MYTRDSTDTETAAEHRSVPRRAAAAPGPVRSAPAGATDITLATILNDTATDTAHAKAPTDPAVSDSAPASGHGLPASPETAATLAARRATRRRRFAWFFGVLAIVALGAALYWFIVGRFSEETDDAYVAGNVVQIAAQIQGTVTDVLVADTQQVKAGQALVRLDDAEAAAAFAQAQAQLAQAVRQVANTRLSMQTYEQTVKAREADLKLAQQAYRARAGRRWRWWRRRSWRGRSRRWRTRRRRWRERRRNGRRRARWAASGRSGRTRRCSRRPRSSSWRTGT
ncbi:hlyD secretion family protein [Burkholderia pseudomallei 576]|nr:hlyD secretion family protein [Burkholderia pseudomallei 576]